MINMLGHILGKQYLNCVGLYDITHRFNDGMMGAYTLAKRQFEEEKKLGICKNETGFACH